MRSIFLPCLALDVRQIEQLEAGAGRAGGLLYKNAVQTGSHRQAEGVVEDGCLSSREQWDGDPYCSRFRLPGSNDQAGWNVSRPAIA